MPDETFCLAYPILAVHNLQEAAERYAAMGFAILPTRASVAGVAFRTVRLSRNSIVLASPEPSAAQPSALHRALTSRLREREGVALVALDGSADGFAALRERGVQLDGRLLPDTIHTGLTFALPATPRATDAPPVHPNTARTILRVAYAASDPASITPRFSSIWRHTTPRPDGFEVVTATGTLRVLSHTATDARFLIGDMPEHWTQSPQVVAITVLVDSLRALVQTFNRAHIPHSVWGRSVRADTAYAGGVILEFVAPVPVAPVPVAPVPVAPNGHAQI